MQCLLHATKAKLPHEQSHQLHLHAECSHHTPLSAAFAPQDGNINDRTEYPLVIADTYTANKVAVTDLALAVVNDLLVAEVGVYFYLQHCRLDTGIV